MYICGSTPTSQPDYYAAEEVRWLEGIDPLFPINKRQHPSQGKSCRTGQSALAVAGDGTIRRCHFVKEPIGNIYEPGWEQALVPRPCPNTTCGCHIGYVHLNELKLYEVFGGGVLERVPSDER